LNNPALIAVIGLVLILGAGWGWTVVAERRRRGTQARLAAVLVAGPQPRAEAGGAMSLRRPAPTRGAGWLGLLPARILHHLAGEMSSTGDRLKSWHLVTVAGFGMLFSAGLLGYLGWSVVLAAPVVVGTGIVVAAMYLRAAQRRFQRRFVEVFPEALDVIVRAVRAGLPVLDAIEAAAVTVSEPVGGELRRILDELRIGLDLEHVLENAADRVRVNDFRFFAATLMLQRRTGGSLAETLANLAGVIRRRKEIRLKASALTAESRATAWVVGAVPFVMVGLMYLINPSLISLLFTDPRGKILLYIGMFLLASGFVVMRAMIKKAIR
jgi:tight adherence protein B